MRRRLAAAVAVALLGPLLVACSDDEPADEPTAQSGPRPVTADESERLAASRLLNYQRERIAFQMIVPVETGTVMLEGRADMRQHLAIARAASAPTGGASPQHALVAWNLDAAAYTPSSVPVTEEQLDTAGDLPRKDWTVRPFEGSTDPLDQVLLVLLNLAIDRSDNAQLLRQNGAEWRGSTVVQGVEVDIMAATPTNEGGALTYYVDDDGRMVRVDVAAGGAQPASITFLEGDTDDVAEVPAVKALGPVPDTETSENPS